MLRDIASGVVSKFRKFMRSLTPVALGGICVLFLLLFQFMFPGLGTRAVLAQSGSSSGNRVYRDVETTGPVDEVVQISSRAAAAIGLKLQKVSLKPLPLEISILGEIEALPTRSFMQHALMAGRVERVNVELGQKVSSGQVLAVLDSTEINRLAAELLNTRASMEAEIKKLRSQYDTDKEQAQTKLELAQANYERMSTLAREKIASQKARQTAEAEYELAKSTRKNLIRKMEVELDGLETKMKVSIKSLKDRLKQVGVSEESIKKMMDRETAILQVPIRSTKSGVVTGIMANPGETVNGQDPLFEILDLTTVFATADVYEGDMERVKVGQKVLVKTAALPGRIYQGTLSYVGSEIDTKKRTLPVKVKIPNTGLELKPEMFVNMYVETDSPTRAIILPGQAVIEKTGHFGVFLEVKPGVYQRHEVEVGRSIGDDVEILSGIEAGDTVVTQGAFQLDAHVLKKKGDTDAFSHPSESGHSHDHGEGNHEHQAGSKLNPLILMVVVLAFILGGVAAAVFIKFSSSGKNTPPAGYEDED